MTERIEGRVARILNARELVINRGGVDGVEVGMRFAVLNRQGVDIKDPETGESLGSVELPKTVVKVVRVQESLSIARTFRTTYTAGGPLYAATLATSLFAQPPRTKFETLKTDENRLKDELDESDSFVKSGDPVVQMFGDEFDTDLSD